MGGYVKKGWVMDEIDKFILENLIRNAKTTITYFVNKTNLTKGPLSKRINRITNEYITDTISIVDKKKLGYDIDGIFMISLKSQTNECFEEFIEYVGFRPEIRSIKLLTGSCDYIIEFVAKNHRHVNEIMEYIRNSPHLNRLQYFNVLEQNLFRPGVPV